MAMTRTVQRISFCVTITTETVRCVGFPCSSGGDSVSVYEALSLMIAFATLITIIVLSR